ncbi:hypothetical protein LA080_008036 [Diaporthe eres]|nr:hypothetical protein LA080_008036 [Diaporthe eres]
MPAQHIVQLPNAEAIPSQIPRSGALRVRDGVRSDLGKRRVLGMREMLWSGYGPEHRQSCLSTDMPVFSRGAVADAHVALWCLHHTPGRLYSSFFLCDSLSARPFPSIEAVTG